MIGVNDLCFSGPTVDGLGDRVTILCGLDDELKIALDDATLRFLYVNSSGEIVAESNIEREVESDDLPAASGMVSSQRGYDILVDCKGPVRDPRAAVFRSILAETLARFPHLDGAVVPYLPPDDLFKWSEDDLDETLDDLPEDESISLPSPPRFPDVISLSAGRVPRVRWARQIGMFERMAAVEGVLYVVDEGTTAFSLDAGEVLWRVALNGESSSGDVRIGVTSTRVQVDAPDEYYVEFERATGRRMPAGHSRPRDFVAVDSPEPATCSFDDDEAVVGTANGRAVWRLEVDGDRMVDGQLLAVGDVIAVAMSDQRVIVLE